MPLIGLTGGYASGKSLVAGIFEELGAVTIDADLLAREVVEPGSEGLKKIVSRFGPGILNADGSLDRKKLGAIVFNDRAKLAALEEIIHPLVRALLFQRAMETLSRDPKTAVIAVVPLLFEKGLDNKMDKTITVVCGPQQQIERAMKRDGITADEAKKRIALQRPLEEKAAMSDFTIHNSGPIDQTKLHVLGIWKAISGQV